MKIHFVTRKVFIGLYTILFFSMVCQSQERVESLDDILIGTARDFSYIVTAPIRMNRMSLLATAGVIGGIYAVGAYDVKIRKNIQHSRNDGMRRTFEELEEKCFIERLGRSSGVMTVFSSFYAGGWILDNSRARKVAYIGVESWLYNDLLTKAFKNALGRERPGGGNTSNFHNWSGDSSMPSGHTSTAFCMASVIATEYDSIWIDMLSYGTASLVAFSRLYRDVHWASDTVAAAALGITIGKTTHRLYENDPKKWSIIFTGSQIVMTRKF